MLNRPQITLVTSNPRVIAQLREEVGDTAELIVHPRLEDFHRAATPTYLKRQNAILISGYERPDANAPEGLSSPGVDEADFIHRTDPTLPIIGLAEYHGSMGRFYRQDYNVMPIHPVSEPPLRSEVFIDRHNPRVGHRGLKFGEWVVRHVARPAAAPA